MGGRGEATGIVQKIAYRSTTFGQDCPNLTYFIFCSIEVLGKFKINTFRMLSKIDQHTRLKYLVSMFGQLDSLHIN